MALGKYGGLTSGRAFTSGQLQMNRLRLFHRRPKGTPTVIFLDDSRWAIFHQLSPLLRRGGVRTVRVTTGRNSRSWLTSRLVYDRYVSLPLQGGEDVLRRIFTEENVIDVQFVETLVAIMIPVVDGLRDGVASRVRDRLLIMDKWRASARFSRRRGTNSRRYCSWRHNSRTGN